MGIDTHCPTCATELMGLARWCHVCGLYVEDMASGGAPEPKPAPVDRRPEAQIRMAIRGALEALGFVVLDFEQGWRRDGSTRVRKGLPDLFIMGFGVGVWRELKSAKGRLTPEQEAFGEDCRRCGIDWGVWRHEGEAIEWAEAVRKAAA